MSAADMDILVIWPLVCVAAASALLAFLLWLRQPRKLPKYQDETEHTGTAFDATRITPRLVRLRQDYLSALHSVPHPLLHAAASVAAARVAIRRMAYFRDIQTDHDHQAR